MTFKILETVDVNSQRIQNVASPSTSTDAATKGYVDGLINGLAWHPAVRVASTTNVTISGPGTTIDGVTLATNDRVLLKNQSTASQNGPWVFNGSAAALTRPVDFAAGSTTVSANSTFYVSEGTTNADTAWTLTTNAPITVDTTSLAFAQVGSGVTYTAGNGISVASNIITAVADPTPATITVGSGGISVNRSKIPAWYQQDVGDGSSTTIAVTHSLSQQYVQYQLFDKTSGAAVFISAVATSSTVLTFTFPSAPTSAQYRVMIEG